MFVVKEPWCPNSPKTLYDTTLSFDPGTQHAYSNLGYCLLGVVIERVTGISYRNFLRSEFKFSRDRLKFVDGPYLEDEVKYDFRFSNFFTDSYYKNIDFYSLSSSAGLSGNAVTLVQDVSSMLDSKPLNVTSDISEIVCDVNEFRSCYEFGFFKYANGPNGFKIYAQEGLLPGNASMLIVDENGGVFAWLGAGQPLQGWSKIQGLYSKVYRFLAGYYSQN